jgi:hypothetical protein
MIKLLLKIILWQPSKKSNVYKPVIEMLLEVKDEKHSRAVVNHLEESGYHVEREAVGDWEE